MSIAVTKAIYSKAIEMFPFLKDEIIRYGLLDKYTLQLVTKSKKQYAFFYKDEKNWALSTMKAYMDIDKNRG